MENLYEGIRTTRDGKPACAAGNGFSTVWLALAGLLLLLGAIVALVAPSPRLEGFPVFAAAIAVVLLIYCLVDWIHAISRPWVATETLDKLLDSACSVAISVGLDGCLTYVNPAAERLLGYHARELFGRHCADILSPAEGRRPLEEIGKLRGVREPPEPTPSDRIAAYLDYLEADCLDAPPSTPTPSFNAQLRSKNGALLPVTVHLSALQGSSGEPKGLLVMVEEQSAAQIDGKASLLEALRQYRQQKILLESVADGICGIDRHGLVSFVNPAAARLLGVAELDLTGRPIHELLHGLAKLNPAGHSRRCAPDCPLRRVTFQQMASAGEEIFFRADGASFPAEYALTPILDQGCFSGAVLSFRDISQRFALDRLKDEFISTVSHELRTPLTSIRGALGLLASGVLGDVNNKAANLLRIAVTNSDRLVRLINDILDLERIQSGREPLIYRKVQLCDVVHQAIEGMQPVAEMAGVRLIHDNTRVEMAADSELLVQVLTNLLSNAVKFSPANSSVSVMLRPGAGGVTVSVIDQGRGIPADKLEAIFGRFQQVDASDSRQKGGSGLGLAICRTIVQQHSGRIWAERNPVCGSTFRVFLPYRPISNEMLQTSLNSTIQQSAASKKNLPTCTLELTEAVWLAPDNRAGNASRLNL